MEDRVIIIFNLESKNETYDIEVPLNITTRELMIGLNNAFNLNIDTNDIKKCFLKVENPYILLRGNMVLGESGIRNGSIINYSE